MGNRRTGVDYKLGSFYREKRLPVAIQHNRVQKAKPSFWLFTGRPWLVFEWLRQFWAHWTARSQLYHTKHKLGQWHAVVIVHCAP